MITINHIVVGKHFLIAKFRLLSAFTHVLTSIFTMIAATSPSFSRRYDSESMMYKHTIHTNALMHYMHNTLGDKFLTCT